MKNIYLLTLFSIGAFSGQATVHTITVGNPINQFSPAITNATCGDTIKWSWSAGSHTTTSTTIPGCATAWDQPINSTSTTFTMVVSCPGTYSYQCTPHASLGMTGAIVVTCSAGVGTISNSFLSTAYPNPFSSKFTIETPNGDGIAVYDNFGKKVREITLLQTANKFEVEASDLSSGIYFYCILKEGAIIEMRKIVKN